MRLMQRNRVWALATVLLFAPTLLFLGVSESAAGDADGTTLYTTHKCNMCHAVASAGVEAKTKSETMLGPDLGGTAREAAWITQYVKKETDIDGKKHKATFKGTDEELDALIKWLAAQAKAE